MNSFELVMVVGAERLHAIGVSRGTVYAIGVSRCIVARRGHG